METIRLIAMMVIALHTTYPAATLQDVYKTCYQDRFGAEHMIPDSARAAAYLDYELSQAATDTMLMPDVEPCGYRHRYERISLAAILRGEKSRDEVLRAFLAPRPEVSTDSRSWSEEWNEIAEIALHEVPEWRNDTLEAELRQAATLGRAVHHSPEFHKTYHPHYRIVRTEN